MYRGGSWVGTAGLCRSAIRGYSLPVRRDDLGFRVAAVPFGKQSERGKERRPRWRVPPGLENPTTPERAVANDQACFLSVPKSVGCLLSSATRAYAAR